MGKHSPRASQSPLTRPCVPRSLRADPSQIRKDMMRPLPRSKAYEVDPLHMHNTTGLVPSISSPLPMVPVQVEEQHPCAIRATADLLGHDDVGAKIQAMLAATEALKPVGDQPSNPTGSKMTRIIPAKVLEKMSSAWERLHFKSTGKNPISRLPLDSLKLTWTDSLSEVKRLSIKSIEIRQNEGVNINENQKARRIAGIEVRRRPVGTPANIRTSASNVRLYATSTPIGSPLPVASEEFPKPFHSLPESPFDAEIGFESDLEDRILSTIPEGSSTPRKLASASVSDCDESLALDHSRLNVNQNPRGTALPQSFSHLATSNTATDSMEKIGQKRLNAYDLLTGCHWVHGIADDCKRVKKHPSPDKHWLEELEAGLEKYKFLKASSAADEELDELADRFVLPSRRLPPSRCLATRDKNQLMSRFSSSTLDSDSILMASSRPTSPPFPKRNSRITRLAETPTKLQPESRLTPPFRPADADADNTDELQ